MLAQLAAKYGSDKVYKHGYIPVYERLFNGLKPRCVLEIGIGYPELMQRQVPDGVQYTVGAGLYMWAEMWPDAEILGIDIREDVLVNTGQISSFCVNQSDPVAMCEFAEEYGPFDIVIDDGSHVLSDQLCSAVVLLPATTSIYVVEDVVPDNGLALQGKLGGVFMQCGKCYDDNLLVVMK